MRDQNKLLIPGETEVAGTLAICWIGTDKMQCAALIHTVQDVYLDPEVTIA